MSYTPKARKTTQDGFTSNDTFHTAQKRGKTVCLPQDDIENARAFRAYYGTDKYRIVYHDKVCAYLVVGNAEARLIEANYDGRIVE